MKFTTAQVGQISRWLQNGYGAEDIALEMKAHPEHVRMQIRKFRANGILGNIASEARQRLKIDMKRRGVSC